MANPVADRFDRIIRVKNGLRANLLLLATTALALQGELFYTTDTKHLFVADSTFVPQPVQTLDMALTWEGDILTYEGNVLFTY